MARPCLISGDAAADHSGDEAGRRPRVVGRRYLRLLRPYLRRLQAAYPHPNRVLFFDDVLVAYLLAFFNPALRSLRTIEDASAIAGVNQFLNVKTICRSTLSDANALFDPNLLAGLIADLHQRLPGAAAAGQVLSQSDPVLARLLNKAILVDGSFFRLAADVQWAIHAANQHGGGKGGGDNGQKPGIGTVRLNCQFALASGVPAGVSINGSDGVHESAAAAALVQSDQLFIFDSGIVSFDYLNTILNANSHLLCNLSAMVKFQPNQARPLCDEDHAAGIVSDSIGILPGSHGHNTPPAALLREIIVQYTDRNGQVRTLRLLTDLLVLPAHLVAELYRQRWQIELFFRWLKINANFSHLTSHSKNGVSLAFHVAVIAALLMVHCTGRPLSKYAYNLLGFVAAGLCDVQEMLPILEKRERERAMERARLARKKARPKIA